MLRLRSGLVIKRCPAAEAGNCSKQRVYRVGMNPETSSSAIEIVNRADGETVMRVASATGAAAMTGAARGSAHH
jgi:hypothetical protein